jgi:acyl carrier protein
MMDNKINSKRDISEYLLNFFLKSHPTENIDFDENFYHQGLIDSFGIIELIELLENEFNIQFSQQDFMDEKFPTIRGLSEIIHDKTSE